MFHHLFLAFAWAFGCVAEGPCCLQKNVGGAFYTLVGEDIEASDYGCQANCVYQKFEEPQSRYCFAKGELEVVCVKDGYQTTPAPIITNFIRLEGDVEVVQENSFQEATGVLELTVPPHKDYPRSLTLFHEESKTLMLKNNGTCRLTDLPKDINVKDTAKSFEINEERLEEKRFYIKTTQYRLGYAERARQIPEVKGHCEQSKVIKTLDFVVNEEEYKKYKRGEIFQIYDQKNPNTNESCNSTKVCSPTGPPSCNGRGWKNPVTGKIISLHDFVGAGEWCVTCNILSSPAATAMCDNKTICNCSHITGLATILGCDAKGGQDITYYKNGVMTNVQRVLYKQESRPSFIFTSPAHEDLENLEVVMTDFADNNVKTTNLNYLIKIGSHCHLSELNHDPWEYIKGFFEIKAGNSFTDENDELNSYTILINDEKLTDIETTALHPDIQDTCTGIPPTKFVEKPITKTQSDELKNWNPIFPFPFSTSYEGSCQLRWAAKRKGSAGWRWPNPDSSKLWIYEIIHSVDVFECCFSLDEDSICCNDNFPQSVQCCVKLVIQSNSYGDFDEYYGPNMFHGKNVFTNSQDYRDMVTKTSNYWLSYHGYTGARTQLILSLGCTLPIYGFWIKNTHNYNLHNAGTKAFSIFISEKPEGPWEKVLDASLKDARNVSPVPIETFNLPNKVSAKYVMFQVDSYYGAHGGLQYFDIIDPGTTLETVTAPTLPTIATTTGPVWRKVYTLNTAGGLFNSLDDAKKKNIDDPEANLFSILFDLESMRNREEVFHFKLCYPELNQCNEWVQSSNPVTESTITGYSAITLSWNVRGGGGAFQGLGLSPTNINNNLIDDVPDNSYWWGSIGTLTYYGGSDTVPAIYPSTVVKKVELSILFTPSG